MKDHMDISSFNAAVDAIPLMDSITRIDKALRLAQKELFAPENGGRPNIPEILIVLTDGSQTPAHDSEDPGDIANEIRNTGVQIIVIGIGGETDVKELDCIAGGDGKAFTVKSFDALTSDDFINVLSVKTCATAEPPKCEDKVDVGFILDSSGSLKTEYHKEKAFLKELAGAFGISPDGSRAGVVTFSARAKHSIKMSDHTSLASFAAAVDAIPLMGLTTRIDRALRLSQRELFAPKNGGRPDVKKVLVVLTDGTQTASANAEDPGDVADELRQAGLSIIVIGIGPGIYKKELDHMAGGDGMALFASTFDELAGGKFVGKLAGLACEEAEELKCPPGFKNSVDKIGCEDINECATDNGGCDQICKNLPGTYECSCDAGYKLLDDKKTCQDINECATDNGGCDQICKNLPGTYECGCDVGHKLLDDKKTCQVSAPKCKGKADVGFVLDSSGSLRNQYQKEKDFLKRIAGEFDIGPDGSRAGVVTFSSDAVHSIKLSDHTDIDSFNAAVDAIPHMNSVTRIDRALRLAQKELFAPKNGGRPKLPEVLILLTDGTQTPDFDAEAPSVIADEMRKSGVHFIVVGIGSGTDAEELDAIAGGDGKAVTAESFDKLLNEEFIEKLTEKTCQQARVSKCQRKVDIGFLVDSSGSLEHEYYKEKDFVKTLASAFDIDQDGSRAGVITFSARAEHNIRMKDHMDINSFSAAVDALAHMNRTTRIDRALRLAQSELFAPENGGRPDIPDVLVLLTDGTQTKRGNFEDPCTVTDEIRKSGINIIVIGIGSDVDAKELDDMAGGSGKSFVIKSFDELIEGPFLTEVSGKVCDEAVVTKCQSKVDVGFIMDSSGSLRKEYHKEKEFVKLMATSFDLGPDGSRAGVVTFSWKAEHSIKMKDHMDISSFNAAVDAIPLMNSITRIDKALRLAQKELFASENGGRPNIPQILIVLTDGSQTPAHDAEDPGDIANEIRKTGIQIIVIGIGGETDVKELDCMAGGDGKAFLAKSFDELQSDAFVAELSTQTCNKAEPPKCQADVDVGFIIDSSGSLSKEYHKEKTFLKAIAEAFDIVPGGSRAGVVTFSARSKHSIKLSDHSEFDSFSAAVDAIPLMGFTTRIDKALRLTQKELFAPKNGGRPGVPKLLILLTDGTQTPSADAEDPGDVADELREAGLPIIVIGIGAGIDHKELDHMGGGAGTAVFASSFDELVGGKFITQLLGKACKQGAVLKCKPGFKLAGDKIACEVDRPKSPRLKVPASLSK